MPVHATHDMFPGAHHDEQARQDFVRMFKLKVQSEIGPGNRLLYEKKVKPAFERANDRAPKSRSELRRAMGGEPYNKMWGALLRTSQELLYESVGPSVERQLPELQNRAAGFAGKLGTLELDPALKIPSYHAAVNIHCKPGGYHSELHADNDIFAGAEYDRTVHMYLMGAMGPNNDDFGRSAARWLKRAHPEIEVRRVLDMGCTIGHSTLAWCDEFPDAEIHAIDVAAPCLRYAHARAEAMGKTVHFHQMNAEHTSFEAGSFDVVVSHIMMHETSTKALPRIYKECRRLLRPGGITMHLDARFVGANIYDQYQQEWDSHYNNEPFFGTLCDTDLVGAARAAGFADSDIDERFIPSHYKPRGGLEAPINDAKKGDYFMLSALR
ncbi:MAG: methyltransferase domain-containing protein [Alphaproteobacteria bacterium]|nr:methyltransferase domain-containing protein [Alphaproteobacteria bacterium]